MDEQITIDSQPKATVLTVPIVINAPEGERGERGPRGEAGADGLQGEQGPQGDQGEQGIPGEGTRTPLTEDTTYYVATNGSDSNDGSVSSPWLTIQHAIDFAYSSLDTQGFPITIQLADGSYDGDLTAFGPLQGNSSITIIGNTGDFTAVELDYGASSALTAMNGARINLNSLTVTQSGGSGESAIVSQFGAQVNLVDVIITDNAGWQLDSNWWGYIQATGVTMDTATAYGYATANNHGLVQISDVDLPQAIAISTGFVQASNLGKILANSLSITGAGVAGTTGPRYVVDSNGVIDVGSDDDEVFPGDLPGTFATGGQYVSSTAPRPGTERIQLIADTDFYVDPAGDNSNSGSASSPWLTVTYAIQHVIDNYDLRNFKVTIHLADGTYNEYVLVRGIIVGQYFQEAITVVGSSTPGNVQVGDGSAAVGVQATRGILFKDMDFLGDANTGLNGFAMYQNIRYSGNVTCIYVTEQSQVITYGGGVMLAGGDSLFDVDEQSYLELNGGFDVPNSLAFTSACAFCNRQSQINAVAASFSGAGIAGTTGQRYLAQLNSLIDTGGGGANFFPGNVPGVALTPNTYN